MRKALPAGRLAAAVVLALACGDGAEVRAFTPETRVRIVDEAIRLMPKSLRLALERHREAVLRGALEPLREEDGAPHRPPRDGGTLPDATAAEAEAVIAAVGEPAPFEEVCRRFGRLAHFVTDAGSPPLAAGREGESRYGHFARYTAEKLPKFPLVFHGHDDPALARGDFSAFTRSVLEQARGEDRNLARVYAVAGDPPGPAFFDDRSIPFAVASLAWSRTVTHVVRAWLAAWERAGGDMGRTPYFHSPDTKVGNPED